MKPQLHKLPVEQNASFLFTQWNCKYFDKPWHFHEEYELVLIQKSKGTKFIGNHVGLFGEGDLYLIGSNIPHLFRNHEDYYEEGTELEARSIFVHFSEHCLGDTFFLLPEMKSVRKLLDRSAHVLELRGKVKSAIGKRLQEMCEENPTRRLLSILEILIRLAESSEVKPILSVQYTNPQTTNTKDTERIHRVFEYIMKHYTQEIYVTKVAAMLNMSDASFSRYFKHHTRKTFSDYVTEVRIQHACRLLMHGDENINEITYASGFENLSNFYRHFKKMTGVSPKEYRTRFLKNIRSQG